MAFGIRLNQYTPTLDAQQQVAHKQLKNQVNQVDMTTNMSAKELKEFSKWLNQWISSTATPETLNPANSTSLEARKATLNALPQLLAAQANQKLGKGNYDDFALQSNIKQLMEMANNAVIQMEELYQSMTSTSINQELSVLNANNTYRSTITNIINSKLQSAEVNLTAKSTYTKGEQLSTLTKLIQESQNQNNPDKKLHKGITEAIKDGIFDRVFLNNVLVDLQDSQETALGNIQSSIINSIGRNADGTMNVKQAKSFTAIYTRDDNGKLKHSSTEQAQSILEQVSSGLSNKTITDLGKIIGSTISTNSAIDYTNPQKRAEAKVEIETSLDKLIDTSMKSRLSSDELKQAKETAKAMINLSTQRIDINEEKTKELEQQSTNIFSRLGGLVLPVMVVGTLLKNLLPGSIGLGVMAATAIPMLGRALDGFDWENLMENFDNITAELKKNPNSIDAPTKKAPPVPVVQSATP